MLQESPQQDSGQIMSKSLFLRGSSLLCATLMLVTHTVPVAQAGKVGRLHWSWSAQANGQTYGDSGERDITEDEVVAAASPTPQVGGPTDPSNDGGLVNTAPVRVIAGSSSDDSTKNTEPVGAAGPSVLSDLKSRMQSEETIGNSNLLRDQQLAAAKKQIAAANRTAAEAKKELMELKEEFEKLQEKQRKEQEEAEKAGMLGSLEAFCSCCYRREQCL